MFLSWLAIGKRLEYIILCIPKHLQFRLSVSRGSITQLWRQGALKLWNHGRRKKKTLITISSQGLEEPTNNVSLMTIINHIVNFNIVYFLQNSIQIFHFIYNFNHKFRNQYKKHLVFTLPVKLLKWVNIYKTW